jgi:hypothetical protein
MDGTNFRKIWRIILQTLCRRSEELEFLYLKHSDGYLLLWLEAIKILPSMPSACPFSLEAVFLTEKRSTYGSINPKFSFFVCRLRFVLPGN